MEKIERHRTDNDISGDGSGALLKIKISKAKSFEGRYSNYLGYLQELNRFAEFKIATAMYL